MRRVGVFATVLLFAGLGGCATSKHASPAAAEFSLESSPAHVNRIIAGRRPLNIISASGERAATAITLTASSSLNGMAVSFQSPTIDPGGSAVELWASVPEVSEDTPVTVTVTGRRGSTEHTITFTATIIPGVDDIASTANDIVAIFLRDLQGKVAGLADEASALPNGTPVAGLLVVTHYAWFTDRYEIGLAWHIMVAPNDFAEFYVRPRNGLTPSQAYRVNSWSTALKGGAYTMSEITVAEVTR